MRGLLVPTSGGEDSNPSPRYRWDDRALFCTIENLQLGFCLFLSFQAISFGQIF